MKIIKNKIFDEIFTFFYKRLSITNFFNDFYSIDVNSLLLFSIFERISKEKVILQFSFILEYHVWKLDRFTDIKILNSRMYRRYFCK